jgi:hypothetical protein
MSGASIAHVYRYPVASAIERSGAPVLRLATSGGSAESPTFFRGRLTRPYVTAQFLRGLSRVVGARYHVPPAMLTRILREADPVVTSGGGLLRFEGFSACASAYARVDLTPRVYDGDVVGHGTTNVDFNAPMRAALAGVTDGDALALRVGVDRVELDRGDDTVVERKVPLPLRWLKGFVEVQAYQARMEPRFTLDGPDALRFLRALPRVSTSRHEQWLVPAGRSVRLSMTQAKDAVRVSGTERLRVLEDMVGGSKALRVYADAGGQSTAWELDADGLRFTLVLSADVWRGFSGEGQALEPLAAMARREPLLARARATLKWQATIPPADLAAALGASAEDATRALLMLGSRGLVGFDVSSGAFFHRELPFDLSAVDALHPRLLAAKKLLGEAGVEIGGLAAGEPTEVFVTGSGVVHRVRFDGEEARCTCPWFSKYEGARGPCKHVLAAQMFVEERTS